MYLCINDNYCPDTEAFDSIEAFLAMCADCFGAAPALTDLPDGRIVDEAGAVVLVAVRS